MPSESLKEWLERADDLYANDAYGVQRGNHVPVWGTKNSLAFQLRFQIDIWVAPSGIDVEERHFIAVSEGFVLSHLQDMLRSAPVLTVSQGRFVGHSQAHLVCADGGDLDGAVLVVVGEVSEDTQDAEHVRVVSLDLKWLEILSQRCGGRGHVSPVRMVGPTVLFGLVEDGKLNVPGLGLIRLTPEMSDGKLPGKIVERGTEVAYRISDQEPSILGEAWPGRADNRAPFCVKVSPDFNGVRLAVRKIAQTFPQHIDVAFRVVELGPARECLPRGAAWRSLSNFAKPS